MISLEIKPRTAPPVEPVGNRKRKKQRKQKKTKQKKKKKKNLSLAATSFVIYELAGNV